MTNGKRLIDANELTERIKSYAGMFTDELGFVVSLEAVLGGMEFSPTVDAVEVVRCKDCKHWYKSKEFSPFGWCCQRNDLVHVSYRDRMNPEDFCSKGERRDNEN